MGAAAELLETIWIFVFGTVGFWHCIGKPIVAYFRGDWWISPRYNPPRPKWKATTPPDDDPNWSPR